MMVASVKSTTVHCRPFRPRFSLLSLAARRDHGGPCTLAFPTGSPSHSDTRVPWSRLPKCLECFQMVPEQGGGPSFGLEAILAGMEVHHLLHHLLHCLPLLSGTTRAGAGPLALRPAARRPWARRTVRASHCDRPDAVVPVAGCWPNLFTPSHPPLNQVSSG
jgi:hypothetical protein